MKRKKQMGLSDVPGNKELMKHEFSERMIAPLKKQDKATRKPLQIPLRFPINKNK